MNQGLIYLEQEGTSYSSMIFYLLLFLLPLFVVWFRKYDQQNKHNVPPSPWKFPIIGNLHQLYDPPHKALYSLAQKHGPLMLLMFGRVPTLVVSSAKITGQIMKTYDHVFSSRPNPSLASRVLLYGKDIAFSPYGEYWRQVRKICVLQLLSRKKVESFQVVREEEVGWMVEKILCCSSLVNLSELVVSLTNNVICRVAFGKKYGEDEGGMKFKKLLDEFTYLLGNFYVGDLIPSLAWVDKLNGMNARVEKNFQELDSFLNAVVEEHIYKKKKIGGGGGTATEDLVDILLEIEKDTSLGIPIARDNIKAILMDMFAAGTDTTSVVLEWAMSELLKHKEIMIQVQEEVRRIARGKTLLREDDGIESMHLLKSVIKETLRLHPPVPLLIPRESMENTNIEGYNIPAKTTVIVNAFAVGRDPLSWEEPEKFFPKRFMSGDASDIDFKGQNFELVPFGAGRRGCPGTAFAAALVEVALANLLNMFDWGLPNGMEDKYLDMDERSGLSIHRKNDLLVTAMPHYSV